MAGGVVLSDLSWDGISNEFSYLEARVSTLEQVYHEKIAPTVDEINLIQSSVYPIFAIFIIASLIGLVFVGKKSQKRGHVTDASPHFSHPRVSKSNSLKPYVHAKSIPGFGPLFSSK